MNKRLIGYDLPLAGISAALDRLESTQPCWHVSPH
jgi:hypothetical protein